MAGYGDSESNLVAYITGRESREGAGWTPIALGSELTIAREGREILLDKERDAYDPIFHKRV